MSEGASGSSCVEAAEDVVLELVVGGGARRGGRGRKLHEVDGRCETRVKISEMRRCWTLVSYRVVSDKMSL